MVLVRGRCVVKCSFHTKTGEFDADILHSLAVCDFEVQQHRPDTSTWGAIARWYSSWGWQVLSNAKVSADPQNQSESSK